MRSYLNCDLAQRPADRIKGFAIRPVALTFRLWVTIADAPERGSQVFRLDAN
jgi:hypothetical protein